MISSSPMPPGISGVPAYIGRPQLDQQIGFANTRSLTAIVRLIATLCSMTPASARIPRFGSTFGTVCCNDGIVRQIDFDVAQHAAIVP